MPAPALALLARELRVDVRRKRSHLLRLACTGLIFLALLATDVSGSATGAPGLEFFRLITYFNFVVLTLAGVGYFATTVTDDKDEGTFDLLKLAGIGPLGLLLGKSTTRLLATLLILAVQLPFTLLAVTLGGVVPQQVLAMYASLAAYAILLANLGLLCSVVARGSAVATGTAAVLLGLYLVGIPAVQSNWIGMVRNGVVNPNSESGQVMADMVAALREWSIWHRMSDVLSARFAGRVWSLHVASSLAAAGALFGLSWLGLRFVTRAEPARTRGFLPGPRRGRDRCRCSRRAWRAALLWKELYCSWGGPGTIVMRVLVYIGAVIAVGLVALEPPVRQLDRESFSRAIMSLMIFLLAAESSLYASLMFRDEIRNQTLPLVVLLPVSTARIAWAKTAGAALQLVPAAAVFLLAAATYPEGVREALGVWLPSATAWLILLLFVIFVHVTAYLSLYVKWGALPLAFFVVFGSGYLLCLMPLSMLRTGSPGIAPLWVGLAIPATGAISASLDLAIAKRLRTLAGR